MAKPSNEEIVRRYVAAHTAHDYDTVGALRDPEWTVEWPQSGERVRGGANDRAIMDNWPGGLPSDLSVRVVGSEDQWVPTPMNTIHRVVGKRRLLVRRWVEPLPGWLDLVPRRRDPAPGRQGVSRDVVLRPAIRCTRVASGVGRADQLRGPLATLAHSEGPQREPGCTVRAWLRRDMTEGKPVRHPRS